MTVIEARQLQPHPHITRQASHRYPLDVLEVGERAAWWLRFYS